MKQIRTMEMATRVAMEMKEDMNLALLFLKTHGLPDFSVEVKEWRPNIMEVVIRKSKDYPFTNAPFIGGTMETIMKKVEDWQLKYEKIYMVVEAYKDENGIPQPQVSIKVKMVEW